MRDTRPGRPPPNPAIDLGRLRDDMHRLGKIGRAVDGRGIDRPGFSPADMEARAFVAERMRAIGLIQSVDAVGNVSGLWPTGDGPRIMTGSHVDTVPNGGDFDGALGVCAALECVRTMREAGLTPQRPIEVVATAEEEGRFGGMLGAQAMAGVVDERWFGSAVDETGVRLTEAMRAAGLDPARIGEAARAPADIHAFVELHVEQGPMLDRLGIPVGVVDCISGVFKWQVCLTGVANHAGSTPMDMRNDALVGLADFIHAIPDLIAAAGTGDSRVTVGSLAVQPNHPHTIPGTASFTLVGRDTAREAMQALAAASRSRLEAAAARHGLQLEISEQTWLDPKACHPDIVATFQAQATKLGLPFRTMASGGGHDTQFMAELTRAGMIFVPSIGGISHAPDEDTDAADVEAGANLLLHVLIELSGA